MILNKKNGFTIAEILIVLVIAGFIALMFVKAANKSTTHYANNLGTYSAYKSLETAAYDMSVNPGCSAYDTATDNTMTPNRPYCNALTGFLPWYLTTSETTTPKRGFCDRLVREYLNTIQADCTVTPTATDSSDFNSLTPHFTTTNGMRFFFSSTGSPSSQAATAAYQIYVDIDGKGKRKGQVNVDVVRFRIGMDGSIMPTPGYIAANSTDYLTASVRYVNASNNYVYVLSGASFKQAFCLANTSTAVMPRLYNTAYCDPGSSVTTAAGVTFYLKDYTTQAGTPASVCIPNTPNASGGFACEAVVDKPSIMGNRGQE